MKLSKPQIAHLRALMAGERGSYPGLNIGVLNSLKMKGLVSAKYGLGSIAMPHTSIKWRLTAEGSKFMRGQQALAAPTAAALSSDDRKNGEI